MPAPKGHPRYGGRKKGTPNKDSNLVRDKAKALGIDPFEVLLYFVAGDWEKLGYAARERVVGYSQSGDEITGDIISPELRQKAARDACEYLHPKLKSIDHTTAGGAPVATGVIVYQAQWGATTEAAEEDEDPDEGT